MRERLFETPSQTAGPYVHIGTAPQSIDRPALSGQPGPEIASDTGPAITVEGIVHDGAGAPVRDAMLEIWQADGKGRVGPDGLFARAVADFGSGLFRFQTVKPGIHAEGHAPHIAVLIFARGINIHLHTRIYFPEDRKLIAADPDFARLSPEARDTLIASPGEGGGYRFDVHLQGPQETVFFDI
jgi:protocatechuate 3,4-dioxygenase alpha subunit